MDYLDEHWTKDDINLGFSARTYITNVIPKFETLFKKELKNVKTPMDESLHPELDDSPFLSCKDASVDRSIIGSLNWVVTLGRFDVFYATSTLSRYSMQPREGHMKAAKKGHGISENLPQRKNTI